MTINIPYKKRLILAFGLCMLVLGSCTNSQEELYTEKEFQDEAPCVLTIQADAASRDATGPEVAIRTLRLYIFQEDGKLVGKPQLLNSQDALTNIPTNTYDYFAHVNGEYRIGKLLAKKPLRFVVVANELTSMEAITTLDGIKKQTLDYNRAYSDADGKLNINITGNSSSNMGYIPMFAESKLLTPYEWDKTNGTPVILPLVRALSKVTLRISTEGAIPELKENEVLAITSASIINVPRTCTLGAAGVEYQSTLVNTDTKRFGQSLEGITKDSNEAKSTDILTFYIPENILREDVFNNEVYSYIQVNGTVIDTVAFQTINTTYKIPLGDGVSKITGTDISGLSREDLCITRNTHYQVEAKLTTSGTLDIFQLRVLFYDWKPNNNIDVELGVPYLNVTSLKVNMSEKELYVYFWTNQTNPFIATEGIKSSSNESFDVNTIFDDLSSTLNFVVQEINAHSYKGHFVLKFKEAATYTTAENYILTLNAGALKREITVVANPVVAQIKIDPNGGTMSQGDMVQNVYYKDIVGKPGIFGSTIPITPNVTPPAGKKILLWIYSSDERQVDSADLWQTLEVELKGYTTSIKPIWIDN